MPPPALSGLPGKPESSFTQTPPPSTSLFPEAFSRRKVIFENRRRLHNLGRIVQWHLPCLSGEGAEAFPDLEHSGSAVQPGPGFDSHLGGGWKSPAAKRLSLTGFYGAY